MPDLLAHALLAYAAATLVSVRYPAFTGPYVTAAMAGAFLPDLAKMELVVPNGVMYHLLGTTWHWFALHTGGAVVATVLLGVALAVRGSRRRVLLALSLGAGTHLVADLFLRTPSGRSFPVLWPLTYYHPPTPGLYLSTQVEPTFVSAALAAGAWLAARRLGRDAAGP